MSAFPSWRAEAFGFGRFAMTLKGRILLVAADPDLVFALTDALAADHDVVAVRDGHAAIEVAATHPPDLLLFAPGLPDMDGWTMSTAIRALPDCSSLPQLVLLAQGAAAEETRALDQMAAEIVTLPLNPPLLRHRVQTQLRLLQLAAALRRLSLTDNVTGVANQRAFAETLDKEWRRCTRTGRAIALLVIEIDHFRSFTDHYGGSDGQACLASVARALASCISRPSDLVARTGSETFSAVLSDTDGDGAWRVVENIFSEIERLGLPHAASPTADRLTVSIGLASIAPQFGQSSQAVVLAAEEQLRRAKSYGHNRCVAITLE